MLFLGKLGKSRRNLKMCTVLFRWSLKAKGNWKFLLEIIILGLDCLVLEINWAKLMINGCCI